MWKPRGRAHWLSSDRKQIRLGEGRSFTWGSRRCEGFAGGNGMRAWIRVWMHLYFQTR